MSDQDFLNELTKRGFTPAWYIDLYHNYDPDHNCELNYPEYIQVELDWLNDQYHKSLLWSEQHDLMNKIHTLKTNSQAEVLGAFNSFKEIESVGNGEGEGQHFHVILHFPEFDKYLYAEAYYASYEGLSDFDEEWSIVEPVQVTVTQYHKRNESVN